MSSSKKQQYINKTQHQEVSIPCIKCTGKTDHKVLVSVDVRGKEEEFQLDWANDYQIIQCLGCKTISFRTANSQSDEIEQTGDDEWTEIVHEEIYPSRIEGMKGIGDDVFHLPSNIRRIYSETLMALTNQAPVLAGIGLRALLEAVCKEKNATGKDLFQKIDNLTANGILTPTSAAILHKIRTLGNAAAHEVKPHSEKQLGLAIDIIEHLLKDIYILPKQVEAEFD